LIDLLVKLLSGCAGVCEPRMEAGLSPFGGGCDLSGFEANFREFVSRPENAALAEAAQHEEALAALEAQEARRLAAFMEQVAVVR
jgi:hypothetical protein